MPTERAKKLKDEGNALFAKEDYKAAVQKYTQAIALDDKNAILYANRAACRLGMKRYMDAGMDAAKATQLDPNYAKAWARLATAQDALLQPHNSQGSWKKALDSLPKENLTEGEKKQKQQYEVALAKAITAAERALQTPIQLPQFNNSQSNSMPWVIAKAMIPQLEREGNTKSSAWVISGAYDDFEQGTLKMDQVRTIGLMAQFNMQVIEHITNAILTDQRCFHISNPTWLEKLQRQFRGENTCLSGWAYEPFDTLYENMEKRIRSDGWEKARQTLGTCLRTWIAMGFTDGGLQNNQDKMVEFLNRVIQVIKWGREKWADMGPELRGGIFEETFLRGVQYLHMETLMKLAAGEKTAANKLKILEELLEEANEVIKSVEGKIAPTGTHYAFQLAYYDYPCGHAHAMRGYVSREKAKLTNDKLEESKLCLEAGVSYMNAANKLPDDDEYHCFYLNVAVECLTTGSASPQLVLKAMDQLKRSVPKMQKIWVVSSLALGGRDAMIKHTLDKEAEYRRKANQGQ
ncbi:hypothetical protein VNI00_014425 [Paramarasmius palmivorus]|uniref:Uncharacterized protein n=1 Tax=Paramarasmius palmivorus TaxID=297713 RepID=A0AAW0BT95_9AGAR